MKKYIAKHMKDDPEKWGYTKNTPEFIEFINKETKEVRRLNKDECRITGF